MPVYISQSVKSNTRRIKSTLYTLALGLGTLKQRFLGCRWPLDISHYLDVDKFLWPLLRDQSHKRENRPLNLGAHLELYQGTRNKPCRERIPYTWTLRQKVLPNRQFASGYCPLFFIMKTCNSVIFFHSIGKMKNVRIRDLVISW